MFYNIYVNKYMSMHDSDHRATIESRTKHELLVALTLWFMVAGLCVLVAHSLAAGVM